MNLVDLTFSNTFWKFGERLCIQIINMIVSIVLARKIAPDAYGTLALAFVFMSFLQIFADCGLGIALIQKKDADDLDFSSVFYLNILICIFLYIILYVISPFISKYYNNEVLSLVIKIMGINIIIFGINNTLNSYISHKLIFKKNFIPSLLSSLIGGGVGIWGAYKGYGVWALVINSIVVSIIGTILLWFAVGWYPKLTFSLTRIKPLIKFAYKLQVSSIIDTIYKNLRVLIIGKIYTTNDLAYYNKGRMYPVLICDNINNTISNILFPIFTKKQDDTMMLQNMMRRSLKVCSYIIFPIMGGLAAVSSELIPFLLTKKWTPCIPYLYIYCFCKACEPIQTTNLSAIRAVGRSDIILKLEIYKKIFGIFLICITMKISVFALGVSLVIYSIYALILNSYPNRILFYYSLKRQIIDVLPNIIISSIMILVVFAIGMIKINNVLYIIILKILIGVIIYLGLSILTKNESFEYLYSKMKTFCASRIK